MTLTKYPQNTKIRPEMDELGPVEASVVMSGSQNAFLVSKIGGENLGRVRGRGREGGLKK